MNQSVTERAFVCLCLVMCVYDFLKLRLANSIVVLIRQSWVPDGGNNLLFSTSNVGTPSNMVRDSKIDGYCRCRSVHSNIAVAITVDHCPCALAASHFIQN